MLPLALSRSCTNLILDCQGVALLTEEERKERRERRGIHLLSSGCHEENILSFQIRLFK